MWLLFFLVCILNYVVLTGLPSAPARPGRPALPPFPGSPYRKHDEHFQWHASFDRAFQTESWPTDDYLIWWQTFRYNSLHVSSRINRNIKATCLAVVKIHFYCNTLVNTSHSMQTQHTVNVDVLDTQMALVALNVQQLILNVCEAFLEYSHGRIRNFIWKN